MASGYQKALLHRVCGFKLLNSGERFRAILALLFLLHCHTSISQLMLSCLLILKERRLRWYGHVERFNGAVKTAFDIQVNGKRRPGRPKMTWKQLTERDRREWKLSAIDPHDRDTWRSGVRSAMRAASQLAGRGPIVVDMAPIPAR